MVPRKTTSASFFAFFTEIDVHVHPRATDTLHAAQMRKAAFIGH
jgi:hypothetical protein